MTSRETGNVETIRYFDGENDGKESMVIAFGTERVAGLLGRPAIAEFMARQGYSVSAVESEDWGSQAVEIRPPMGVLDVGHLTVLCLDEYASVLQEEGVAPKSTILSITDYHQPAINPATGTAL
jgi:hypothetical protein